MWWMTALTGAVVATLVTSAGCSQKDASEDGLEQRQQETERLRPLLARVLPLRSQCDPIDPVSSVPIRGKVLAWAADYGHRSERLEPANLHANRLDEPITVFLYRSLRHERGWFLTRTKDETQTLLRSPAYREDIEICAVYWPEGSIAGRVLLEGGEPPMSGGQPQAEHGTLPDLKAWLDRQPIETR